MHICFYLILVKKYKKDVYTNFIYELFRKYQAETEIISVVVVGSQHILDLRLFTFDYLADQSLEFFLLGEPTSYFCLSPNNFLSLSSHEWLGIQNESNKIVHF